MTQEFKPLLKEWHQFMLAYTEYRSSSKITSESPTQYLKLESKLESISKMVDEFDEDYPDAVVVLEQHSTNPTANKIRLALKQINEFETFQVPGLNKYQLQSAALHLKETHKKIDEYVEGFQYIQRATQPILKLKKPDSTISDLKIVRSSLINMYNGLNGLYCRIMTRLDSINLLVKSLEQSNRAGGTIFSTYLETELNERKSSLSEVSQTIFSQKANVDSLIDQLDPLLNKMSGDNQPQYSLTELFS